MLNMVEALTKAGEIPDDFKNKEILIQGELPSMSRGADHFFFSDMCPEVNLFDRSNALVPDKACTAASNDKYHRGEKTRIDKTRHFSECGEFNKYQYDSRRVGKGSSNSKRRKSIPLKTRAVLQKEINSKCPFCFNEDVEHFQIHHIDEDPSNNEHGNLLMLCANCHSKITKGDISLGIVVARKRQLGKNGKS